jgi:subtilisin family serine protease
LKFVYCGLRPFAVIPTLFFVILGFAGAAKADQLVYQLTGADLALTKYGLTGKGVVVAILDRGIQWQNADFINPDGTTRIKYMLDMDGQQDCSASNPAPIEYNAAQLNAALAGTGPTIPERDAVGHGTASIGMATGNGRSFAAGKYTGIAPEADLVIIRSVSEAEPAHGTEAAQAAFQACYTQAFQWLDQKLTALGEPAVAFINSENTFGAHDGTSSISTLVDQYFSNRPGRAFVFPSGDEGLLADHAGGTFNGSQDTV